MGDRPVWLSILMSIGAFLVMYATLRGMSAIFGEANNPWDYGGALAFVALERTFRLGRRAA